MCVLCNSLKRTHPLESSCCSCLKRISLQQVGTLAAALTNLTELDLSDRTIQDHDEGESLYMSALRENPIMFQFRELCLGHGLVHMLCCLRVWIVRSDLVNTLDDATPSTFHMFDVSYTTCLVRCRGIF